MSPRKRRAVIVAGISFAVAGCSASEPDDDDEDPRYPGPTIGDTELSPAFPVALEDVETGEEAANIHYHDDGNSHWHFQPLTIPLGEVRVFTVHIRDQDGDSLPIPEMFEVDVTAEDDGPIATTIDRDELRVEGIAESDGWLRLHLHEQNGGQWETPELDVTVEADA